MKLAMSLLRERVLNTLWFWPVTLVALGVLASFAAVELDREVGEVKGRLIFSGSPTSARVVTGTIAGSALSFVGITVPLTIVALQLASSQFSQRILRNFMSDRIVQVFLGAFIGIFAYNVMILRVIRSSDESIDSFVPQISVTIGMALTLFSLALFIIFVNHIVGLIQVTNILRAIVGDTRASMGRLYPASVGLPTDVQDAPEPGPDALVIPATTSGYLQTADLDAILEWTCDKQSVVWLVRSIGEFCPQGTALFLVSGGQDGEDVGDHLRGQVQLGTDRTHHEDPLFGFRQIVDIAARALSPGVNDPTTAIQCLDHLTELVHTLLPRSFPSVVRKDEEGVVRIIVRAPSFETVVSEAFDEIRHYGAGHAAVTRRALLALTELAAYAPTEARRLVLVRQRDLYLNAARREIREPADLAALEAIVTEHRHGLPSAFSTTQD